MCLLLRRMKTKSRANTDITSYSIMIYVVNVAVEVEVMNWEDVVVKT